MFVVDQTATKEACIAVLERANDLGDAWPDMIRSLVADVNVEADKLVPLLHSQVTSGNVKGAIKVVNMIPDTRTSRSAYAVALAVAAILAVVVAKVGIVALPQVLYIAMTALHLASEGKKIGAALLSTALVYALLIWGGFFDVLVP